MKKSVKRTSSRIAGSRKRSSKSRVQRSSSRIAGQRKHTKSRASRKPLEHALAAFAALAKRERLRWYVFGAQAVGFHGFTRASLDLDITIDLGERPLAPLLAKLARAGFAARFSDDAFIAATRVVPMTHTATRLPIDLVLAGPGLEQMFLDRVETRAVGRDAIPVLRIEDLIVTKVLASRPKDLEDVRELLAIATIRHEEVEPLLSMIEQALERGDLVSLYRRLRAA